MSRTERAPRCRLVLVAGLLFAAFPVLSAQETRFRRGDANGDGSRDVSDAIATLRTLFLSEETPACAKAVDANDDGSLDLSDALHTLNYLFLGGSAAPAPGDLCGIDPTPDALGCNSYPSCEVILGQSDFVARTAGPPVGGVPGRDEDGGLGAPAPPADQGAPGGQERTIEESDIYKLSGNNLFILNRYRGLQIVDLSDLDHPRLVGQATIFGYPREMYVRDTNAYVIVSDYYSFWRSAAVEDSVAPSGFHGSQLRIIDISDPGNPRVVGGIDIEGDAGDSRIVGDTMYLVSQRYPWYSNFDTDDTEDKTVVMSVDVSDPANVRVVDQQDFPRNGWEHHLTVTPDAIYLASSGYSAVGERGGGYQTRIRYIDISDPAGAIRVRGEASVDGRVQDRWSMDEHQQTLRVASGQSWGNGDVYLTTLSVADPDQIRPLGRYVLHVDEQLTSARFDGSRGYLVSYRRIDPLFTFDLSDPAKPVLLSELEMTGWLDFMAPMGDRLVALGHEDLTNPDGSRSISLAVSLIDVAQAPKLLSRVTLDGSWGWVPAGRDDFAKVFRVLPEERLIVFPFQAWSPTDWRYVGGVQLIDLDPDRLTRRGLIRDAGWVERGVPYDSGTVLTISSELFQVMDIADRDAPRLRGRLELARNVQSFATLPAPEGADTSVQLAGDWYRGNFELLTTTLEDPNTPEPLGRLSLGAPYGRMFVNGSMAYVVSVQETKAGEQPVTVVQVVDLSDPRNPVKRGLVALPETVWPGYGYWNWGWGDEVVQLDGSTLAFHRFQYYWRCLGCPVDAAAGAINEDPTQKIYLVDLKDPDAPALASTVSLSEEESWAWGLRAFGTTLYLSSYRTTMEGDGNWATRYYLQRIGAADPAHPVLHPPVNIPGYFVGAAEGGQIIYSQENYWDSTFQKSTTAFYALALLGDKAYLQSKVEFPGWANGFQFGGEAAFTTTYSYETVVVGGATQWRSRSTLLAIDLRDPQALRLAGKAEVPADYAYLQKVAGGRAFLGSGPGIFSYLVSDIDQLTFESFFRTQGWSQDITVKNGRAYVTSGYYGVQVLELGAKPAP